MKLNIEYQILYFLKHLLVNIFYTPYLTINNNNINIYLSIYNYKLNKAKIIKIERFLSILFNRNVKIYIEIYHNSLYEPNIINKHILNINKKRLSNKKFRRNLRKLILKMNNKVRFNKYVQSLECRLIGRSNRKPRSRLMKLKFGIIKGQNFYKSYNYYKSVNNGMYGTTTKIRYNLN